MAWQNHLELPTQQQSSVPSASVADDLMTQERAAKFIGLSVPTFSAYVASGSLPDGVMIGPVKRWSKRHLAAFIEEKFIEQQDALRRQRKAASAE